jgi:hypothetical protein
MSATSESARLSTLTRYWSGSDAMRLAGVRDQALGRSCAPRRRRAAREKATATRPASMSTLRWIRRSATCGNQKSSCADIGKEPDRAPLFLSVLSERLGWSRQMIGISRPLTPSPAHFLSPLDTSASRDSVPRIPCPGPFDAFASGRSVERRLLYEGRCRGAVDVEICRRGQNRRARGA